MPGEKCRAAGAGMAIYNVRAQYAEGSKTYVYNTRRVLASLYVVEGLD